MRCPLTPESDNRSLNFELFAGIDGIQFNSASRYGPSPELINYANRVKCTIGCITSHLLVSQVVLVAEVGDQLLKQLLFVDKTLTGRIKASHPNNHNCSNSKEESDNTVRCYNVTCSHLWRNEALVTEFKSWLSKKELRQKEASQLSYNTRSLKIDSVESNVKLDYGYISVSMHKGLTASDNTLDDRNTCTRGTLLIPVFHLRLLCEKYGELLRHMEGDHSEVGSVTSAVTIRYSEAKRTASDGSDSLGNTAQRYFLQNFDLTHCGIKSFVENSDTYQGFSATNFPGAERRLSKKQKPSLKRNASIHSNATAREVPPATASTSYNQTSLDQTSLSLDLSPSTIGHRHDEPVSIISNLPGLNLGDHSELHDMLPQQVLFIPKTLFYDEKN